jgi:hypothetical protein
MDIGHPKTDKLTTQENNYYQVKETTMDNAIINMKLTPQEAVLIENIRASATLTNFGGTGNTSALTFQEWLDGKTEPVRQSDEQTSAKYMQKYMDMDDNEFIDTYAGAVGDDTILAVLQDTLGTARKWEVIFDSIDEDVIDELFEAYVSEDTRRQLFLDSQDREELVAQLVDLIMWGDWTPEN